MSAPRAIFALASLQPLIVALHARARRVDVRSYELLRSEALAERFCPLALDLVRDAIDVVKRVARTQEAVASAVPPGEARPGEVSAPWVPFEHALDAALEERTSSPLDVIGDVAFLAGMELRQRAERLERVNASWQPSAILAECDSALRRIRKVATSLDLALAQAGVVLPGLDHLPELRASLRVRKALGRLRSLVLEGGTPDDDALHTRLRLAGTALATMVGWEAYPLVRVGDRLLMREVQARISAWTLGDRDPVEGRRLWQDVAAFAEMMRHVNRRQELREHDRRLAAEVTAELEGARGELPSAVREKLQALAGVSDAIDALLAGPTTGDLELWREALAPLR